MRALPALALLIAGATLSAQSPQPSEPPQRAAGVYRTSATAVVLDVVVRDGRGRPVVNLGPDDFELYEDGVRQTLGSFRAPVAAIASPVARAAAEPASRPGEPASGPAAIPASAVAKPAPREPSVMAFVFDRLSLESRKLALDAVRKYVGDARQTPNIIGVFDVDLALAMLQTFTQDGDAVRESLAKVTATRPVPVDPMHVTDLRSLTEQGFAGRSSGGRPADYLTASVTELFWPLATEYAGRTSMNALGAVVAGLGRAPGRKSIVVFSEGVGLVRDSGANLHALIDQANRANVAMYTVDAAGLRTRTRGFLAGRYAAEATTTDSSGNLRAAAGFETLVQSGPQVVLGTLARETGGQFIENTNDGFKAFARLDEDLRSYYALTYAPLRIEADGKFHRVEVKLKRPGLSAKTRSGYTSLPVGTGSLPVLAYEAPALARLESARVPNELPVLARALVFPVSHETARVPVIVSLPSSALEYGRDESAGTFRAEAVVLVRIRDAQGQVVHKASEQYTIGGSLTHLDESRRRELLFYRQPQLGPGVYTLEAIAQDSRTGKASVRISSLEVPQAIASSLRMGTPFVVQRAERVPAAERDASNPLYFGDLLLYPNLGQPLSKTVDKELTFGFTAWDGHGVPVEASIEVVRSGQAVATAPIALGAADGQGRINQLSRLPLESLSPGAYELRVTLQAGEQHVTRGVRFAIAGN